MSSSSSVTKLLGLYINNSSVDERTLLSEHILPTFIELLVPEGLALSWLDVSILVESHFFNNSLSYTKKCEKFALLFL